MEEILASIRRIIESDDGPADTRASVAAPSAAPDPSPRPNPAELRLVPLPAPVRQPSAAVHTPQEASREPVWGREANDAGLAPKAPAAEIPPAPPALPPTPKGVDRFTSALRKLGRPAAPPVSAPPAPAPTARREASKALRMETGAAVAKLRAAADRIAAPQPVLAPSAPVRVEAPIPARLSARPPVAAPAIEIVNKKIEDEVLLGIDEKELMDALLHELDAEPARAVPVAPLRLPAPASEAPRVSEISTLMSREAGAQAAAAFDNLASAIRDGHMSSMETMTRELLRPMLHEWLDDNLPRLVERLVREEIERVARGARR